MHLFLKFHGPTSYTLADCGPQAMTSLRHNCCNSVIFCCVSQRWIYTRKSKVCLAKYYCTPVHELCWWQWDILSAQFHIVFRTLCSVGKWTDSRNDSAWEPFYFSEANTKCSRLPHVLFFIHTEVFAKVFILKLRHQEWIPTFSDLQMNDYYQRGEIWLPKL